MFCDEEKYDFVIYRVFFRISFYENMKFIINITLPSIRRINI